MRAGFAVAAQPLVAHLPENAIGTIWAVSPRRCWFTIATRRQARHRIIARRMRWERPEPQLENRSATTPARLPMGRPKPSSEADSAFDSRAAYLIALGFVLIFGTLVRIGMLFGIDFPLNDGGMFMQAIVDLQHAHYALPEVIHYNGLSLPYAYPPLGFYVAGLLADITHAEPFHHPPGRPGDLQRSDARRLHAAGQQLPASARHRRGRLARVRLVPRSHNWEIMGGGLTRSIGFFFAVLAIWQAYLLFTQRTRSTLILTTVFAALACLSHLEMAWFVAFSSVLLFLAYGRTRAALRDSLIVSVGVLALTSPWWGAVIAQHGVQPFINAGHTGSHSAVVILALLLTLNWGQEPLFPIFGAMALIGILSCVVRRRYFLPLWVIVGLVLDPRKFETEAMVPMSMLVGICVIDVVIPIVKLRRASPPSTGASGSTHSITQQNAV